MKFVKILLCLTVVGLFIIACGANKLTNSNVATIAPTTANVNAPPTAAPDEFAGARKIYSASCVGCHREGGEGGEKDLDGTKIKVPNFQSNGAMNASDDKLYNKIVNGEEGEMPAFKNKLSEAEMRNLVRFIRHEFQKKSL